jgi:hypothetical protein
MFKFGSDGDRNTKIFSVRQYVPTSVIRCLVRPARARVLIPRTKRKKRMILTLTITTTGYGSYCRAEYAISILHYIL